MSQSFVADGSDIEAVRQAARELDYDPFIIAKIERAEAVENIDSIIEASDVIIVARGYLGAEMGYAVLTGIQTIRYGDFHEPLIQAWSNATFVDNYWQDRAGVDIPLDGELLTRLPAPAP